MMRQDDLFEELTALLNAAYKPLADMGLHYVAATQNAELTAFRCSLGETFLAEIKGQVVGCITLRKPDPTYAGKSELPEIYQREDIVVFGQFGVAGSLQCHGIGTHLIKRVEDRGRELGAREIACDTAEGALHLIAYYEKLGFRNVAIMKWEPVNYNSVILSKVLKVIGER
jgi:GNAT superfamily N-acetyltransferase